MVFSLPTSATCLLAEMTGGLHDCSRQASLALVAACSCCQCQAVEAADVSILLFQGAPSWSIYTATDIFPSCPNDCRILQVEKDLVVLSCPQNIIHGRGSSPFPAQPVASLTAPPRLCCVPGAISSSRSKALENSVKLPNLGCS